MRRLNKPIALKIAIVHLVLIVIGFIFSINLYGLIVIFALTGAPDTTAFAFNQSFLITYLTGPILLISGAFVFIYRIITALNKKTGNG